MNKDEKDKRGHNCFRIIVLLGWLGLGPYFFSFHIRHLYIAESQSSL